MANMELEKEKLYSMDRVQCPNAKEWDKFREDQLVKTDVSWFCYPPQGWQVGTRLVHGDYGGYMPIGYFQLWHSSQRIRYPITVDGDAEHTDVLHSAEWSRPNRVLIPEMYCVHLASERFPMGANWKGRKTPLFRSGTQLELFDRKEYSK
jgi:hypothetical protein